MCRVSKNFQKGERIKTVEELFEALGQPGNQVVYVSHWGRLTPVGFLASMQAWGIYQMIKNGQLHRVKRIKETA